MQTERNPFRRVKLFFAGYFALLILVLTFIGIMSRMGYKLIDMAMEYLLVGLLTCSVIIVLAVFIINRLQNTAARIAVGIVSAFVTLGAAAAMVAVFSFLMVYNTPLHYTTLVSPGGEAAVVMRRFGKDMEIVEARAAVRRQKSDVQAEGEIQFADFVYQYEVHPRVMRYFYDSEVSANGKLEIGCDSAAQLMYEWTKENTLHLFIENPEAFDSGELQFNMP